MLEVDEDELSASALGLHQLGVLPEQVREPELGCASLTHDALVLVVGPGLPDLGVAPEARSAMSIVAQLDADDLAL